MFSTVLILSSGCVTEPSRIVIRCDQELVNYSDDFRAKAHDELDPTKLPHLKIMMDDYTTLRQNIKECK